MAYSIQTMKTYPTGKVVCLKKTTSWWPWWWRTTTYSDCVFVPKKDYPDLSKVSVQTSTGWIDTYDEFVPKFERLFVDLIFIILIVWLVVFGFYKLIKKIFF